MIRDASPFCASCGSQFMKDGIYKVRAVLMPIYVGCGLIVAALVILRYAL